MMYPFMTLPDNTEITHSEMLSNGKVKVYIETPDEKMVSIMQLATYLTMNGKILMDILKLK